MNTILKKAIILPFLMMIISCTTPEGNENTTISIKTTLGDIQIKLYDGTPLHRDNIIKLINSGFYDGISFHRVIQDFMIQAGDPQTKSESNSNIPDSLNTYTIPAEFNPEYFHKKGALAAARQGDDVNPAKRSSGTQFYIVQGVKYTDDELTMAEQRINTYIKQAQFDKLMTATADSISKSEKTLSEAEIQEIASIKMFQYITSKKDFTFSEEQRNLYKNVGGTPRLDGAYTVFGEVIEGLDIVDKIAAVKTDDYNKPLNDIKIIKINIVKK